MNDIDGPLNWRLDDILKIDSIYIDIKVKPECSTKYMWTDHSLNLDGFQHDEHINLHISCA